MAYRANTKEANRLVVYCPKCPEEAKKVLAMTKKYGYKGSMGMFYACKVCDFEVRNTKGLYKTLPHALVR